MASKHRPGGDPVQMHSAGDYYPVVVAVVDTLVEMPHGTGRSRRYEIFHGDKLEVRYSPEGAEQAAREMHEGLLN